MQRPVNLPRLPLILCCLFVFVLCGANCVAAEKKDNARSKYRTLKVVPFEVDENVKQVLPADFQPKLSEHLVKDLQKTKKFTAVISVPQAPLSNPTEATTPAANLEAGEATKAVAKDTSSPAEQGAVEGSSVLILTGKIIEFDPGSRGKRYIVGFGMGAAIVVAHVKFTDPKDSTVIFERDVQGKMAGGAFGGAASGAATELSREIARIIKKQSF